MGDALPPDVGQHAPDDRERHEADRDVDEEDPVPRGLLGHEAAEQRPDDRADAEHRAEQALVLAALGRGEQVADDGEADREQGAGAEALDAPKDDQLGHVLAQAGQRGADQEHGDAEHQQRLASVQVGQLAVERDRDRRGQQVDRDRTGHHRLAAEIGHDGGQGDADDRLIERAQEQAEQDREQDLHLRAVGQVQGSEAVGRPGVLLEGHGFQGRGSFRQAPAQPVIGDAAGCPGAGMSGADCCRPGWPWACEHGVMVALLSGALASSASRATWRSAAAAAIRSRPWGVMRASAEARMSLLTSSTSSTRSRPICVGRTMTTLRSPETRTRSTSPRSSMRSMIPVALDMEVSRISARWPMGIASWWRSSVRTWKWVMLMPSRTSLWEPAQRRDPTARPRSARTASATCWESGPGTEAGDKVVSIE